MTILKTAFTGLDKGIITPFMAIKNFISQTIQAILVLSLNIVNFTLGFIPAILLSIANIFHQNKSIKNQNILQLSTQCTKYFLHMPYGIGQLLTTLIYAPIALILIPLNPLKFIMACQITRYCTKGSYIPNVLLQNKFDPIMSNVFRNFFMLLFNEKEMLKSCYKNTQQLSSLYEVMKDNNNNSSWQQFKKICSSDTYKDNEISSISVSETSI